MVLQPGRWRLSARAARASQTLLAAGIQGHILASEACITRECQQVASFACRIRRAVIGEAFALAQVVTLAGSNVAASASARRGSAEATLLVAASVAVAVVLLALAVVGGGWSPNAAALGTLAGLSGGMGLLFAYRALKVGAVGVVVPIITSVTTVAITVLGSIIDEAPSFGAWIGASICILAVVMLTRSPRRFRPDRTLTSSGDILRSLGLSVGAGSGFAAFVLLISAIDPSQNLSGLLIARLCVLMVALVAAGYSRPNYGCIRRGAPIAVVAGVLDAAGNLLMLAALQGVPVALLGALSATGPGVAALLSWMLLAERLSRQQIIGISVACVGAFIAVGT